MPTPRILALLLLAAALLFGSSMNPAAAADTPEGWPALTKVGAIEVKAYPVYRAAVVDQEAIGSRGGMNPMFFELFNHIQSNDIPMTAPVEMTYEEVDEQLAERDGMRMSSMAFLYEHTRQGQLGEQGKVQVQDIESKMFVSTGMLGAYEIANFKKGVAQLETWLAKNDEWVAVGEPRHLGYDGPFIPISRRYAEVQIPVAKRGSLEAEERAPRERPVGAGESASGEFESTDESAGSDADSGEQTESVQD